MDSKTNGIVIYRGPSMIDGKPIICIATGLRASSNNEKTGDMIQTWILREDVAPMEAVKTGQDSSICGGCVHRGDGKTGAGRTCYVRVYQAPGNVWKSFHRGNYPVVESGAGVLLAGRRIRLGAYGDPAAVPVHVWEDVLSMAAGWTGYTHQWRAARLRGVARWCQASCDTTRDLEDARALGLGTFRVRPLAGSGAELQAGEIVCPASQEAGYATDCATCQACNGRGVNVAILAHGATAKKYTGTRAGSRRDLVQLSTV